MFIRILNNVVPARSSDFLEFSPENSRVDKFLYETMNNKNYRNLWKVVEMLMLLSHGQATVEKGFSIKKKIENMKDITYVSQRLICDFINSTGGSIHEIEITNQMRTFISNARQRYFKYLEEQKLLSSQKNKRKDTAAELQELKNNKRCLENNIESLLKSADELAENAEENNDLTAICKSNSLRRSAKAKENKLLEVTKSMQIIEKE